MILSLTLCLTAFAQDPEPVPLASDMQDHWTVAEYARQAVLTGQLQEARTIGRNLAEAPAPEALPEAFRPLYAELKSAAKTLGEAKSLPDAGHAVGQLGLTCAECHSFTKAGPTAVNVPEPSPKKPKAGKSDMPLHDWAARWMWYGLIADDGKAWSKGADALAHAEFGERPDVPMGGSTNVTAMEHQTHLVPSMADPADREDMALRFGQLTTACASCHRVSQDAGVKADPAP